jgi:hypothetical protein
VIFQSARTPLSGRPQGKVVKMADADVSAQLLAALNKRWADKKVPGSCSVGGRGCRGFDVSKVKLKLVTIDYDSIGNRIVKDSLTLDETDLRNTSGATVHKGYSYSRQYTDTFEWSITAGIKVGASATWETDNISNYRQG